MARPYTGPPSYPAPPRWGFPLLAWRWPLALPNSVRVDPVRRVSALASTAVPALWMAAALATAAALAEGWRYVLLVMSRGSALSETVLALSDALVITTGLLTSVLGLTCAVIVVLWALCARTVANERIGAQAARSDWQFVAGVVIPGWNLFVPGSCLAELEHATLIADGARARGVRPKPSRLVLLWWACWAASLVLGWFAFGWGFRGGVQALADGVALHMWNNVAVAALAVVTVHVVKYLTRLLTPVDPTELPPRRLLEVRGASIPPRRPRSPHAPR